MLNLFAALSNDGYLDLRDLFDDISIRILENKMSNVYQIPFSNFKGNENPGVLTDKFYEIAMMLEFLDRRMGVPGKIISWAIYFLEKYIPLVKIEGLGWGNNRTILVKSGTIVLNKLKDLVKEAGDQYWDTNLYYEE